MVFLWYGTVMLFLWYGTVIFLTTDSASSFKLPATYCVVDTLAVMTSDPR